MNKSRAHSIYSKQNLDNSEVVKVKPCVLLRHVRKTTLKEEKMLSMKASIIQSRVFQSKSGTYENESKTLGTVNWSQLLPNNLNAHIESSVTLDKNIYFKRKVFDQFIINTNDQRMLNGLAKQYYLNRIFKNFIRIVKDWKYEDEQTVEDENNQ